MSTGQVRYPADPLQFFCEDERFARWIRGRRVVFDAEGLHCELVLSCLQGVGETCSRLEQVYCRTAPGNVGTAVGVPSILVPWARSRSFHRERKAVRFRIPYETEVERVKEGVGELPVLGWMH